VFRYNHNKLTKKKEDPNAANVLLAKNGTEGSPNNMSIIMFLGNGVKEYIEKSAEIIENAISEGKGNHELFHEEVKLYFDKETLADIRKGKKNYYTYTEKAHNRLEKRTLVFSPAS